jgi:hypothetical protein
MLDEVPVKIQTSINIPMLISPDKKYFGTLNCTVGAGGRLTIHKGQRSLMINVCIIDL